MRSLFLLLLSLAGMAGLHAQRGPGGVDAGLAYWFRADTLVTRSLNGDSVSSWNDASGNGYDATASGAEQPIYVASDAGINGRPCVRFDGTQQLLQSGYTGNSNEVMSFGGVFQVQTPSTEIDVIHQHGGRSTIGYRGSAQVDGSKLMDYVGGSLHVGNETTPLSTWLLYQSTFDTLAGGGARLSMYRNDSLHASYGYVRENRSGTSVLGGPGSGGGTRLNGRIAELFKYERALTVTERRIIHNYLSAKYALPIDAANDRYAGDEVANGNYDYDVIGIGSDTSGGSAHVHNTSRFGGGMALSVAGGFGTGDYVFLGHEGTPFEVNSTDIVADSALEARWERDWYVDVTDAGTTVTVDFVFDFSEVGSDVLPDSVANYQLIYRAGRSGAWTSLGGGDSISGDRVHFVDVPVTTDGYMTLGSMDLGASPLPVELVSFTAGADRDRVRLAWRTATERENDRFELQRARLGQDWITLATLPGAGTSTEPRDYRHVDRDPWEGVNYYRLRQIDIDGTVHLSHTVSARVERLPDVLDVWPNPASADLHVRWRDDSDWRVALYDNTGAVRALPVPEGDRGWRLDVSGLATGLYLLVMQDGIRQRTRTVVVDR